jgi:hypothetical protein
MIGTQLRLAALERGLEECDRLGRPAGSEVGRGQVITTLERVGVVGAHGGRAHGTGPRVQGHRPVVQAQALVGPAHRVKQRPLGRLRPAEPPVELLAGPVEHVRNLHLPAVLGGIRAAERFDQKGADRLGLPSRLLRLSQGCLRLNLGLSGLGQGDSRGVIGPPE